MNRLIAQIIQKIFARIRSYGVALTDCFPWTEKDFSWKMRWRMRHDRNPTFVVVQDKYKVKQYAQDRHVRSAEIFYVTDKPETIPFDSLPDSYFVKVNHGYSWNILFKNGEFYLYKPSLNIVEEEGFLEHKITRDEVIGYCKTWLNTKFSTKEWAYSQIAPLVIVEEVLVPFEDNELKDYKFYAFNGVAKVVNILSSSIRQKNENIMLDVNWNMFELPEDKYKHPDAPPKRPENFGEMLEVVERLGKGLDFARVDLYNTTRGITLGEITIYPEGGRPNSPSFDRKFNKWLGDQWVLPELK